MQLAAITIYLVARCKGALVYCFQINMTSADNVRIIVNIYDNFDIKFWVSQKWKTTTQKRTKKNYRTKKNTLKRIYTL